MDSVLEKNVVLVLNRNWQAVNSTTPAHAFCLMSSGAAMGMNMQGLDYMAPVTWEEWLGLPVREGDMSVGCVRGGIRVPTVIIATRFNRVPMRRPKFSFRALHERDGGRCQYTGRKLHPGEGNIDHIVPRSRGGATTWKNCVLSCKRINNRKANRTPEEAGLTLLKEPDSPRTLPVTSFLRNTHGIPDWNHFLVGSTG
jgi:5-methylcytosine-specific restriction endonuclease McrA